MIRIGDFFDQLLNAGIDPSSVDAAELRRIHFFYAYTFIGIFACGGAALVLLVSQPTGFSYFALVATITVLVVLGIILHFIKRTDIVVQLQLIFFFALAWFILTKSDTTTGIFWLYVYAPIAALLLRRKYAVFWILLFTIWVMFLSSTSWLGITTYPDVQIYAFIVSFIPISVFMVAYQRIVEKAELETYSKDRELRETAEKLEAELIFTTQSKKQLDGLSASLAKQNRKLSDSKVALTNLLEDARELETDLKKSKASVERQVAQRTQELSLERSHLTATLESLPIAVILVDKHGNVVSANGHTYQLIELHAPSKNTVAERNKVRKFIDKQLNLMQFIQQCSSTASCVLLPEVDYKGDFYKIVLGPVDSQGDDSKGGVVVIIENITSQKLLDRSKDEFLMIASHELRTPLTAIKGNAAILSKYLNDDMNNKDTQELIDDIQGSSDRLLGVVNDYLELSSLEQGKIPFDCERFDIVPICKQIVGENRSLASENKLKLTFKKPRNLKMYVVADPKRVAQVVQNLLSNAIHYTEAGSVTLELSASNDKVVCRVRDTGVGMSKFSQKNLFEKFNQAQENLLTRDPKRSTGLGLYITKLLVEKMNGSLVLESSALGKGSVFAFSLPTGDLKATKKSFIDDKNI